MTPMFVLVANYTDDCTYQSQQPIAMFSDESVAELVAEALNNLSEDDKKHRFLPSNGFSVEQVNSYDSSSEAKVEEIAKEILAVNFAKSWHEGLRNKL